MFRHRLILPVILASSAPALAQPPVAGDAISASGGWTITLKANAIAGPKYPGASDLGFLAYPSGSIRRAGTDAGFSAPDDGLGIALYETASFRLGPVVRYQPGRYDGSDSRLRGIRDARWAIEPGVFAELWPMPQTLRARFEIRRGFRGHEGAIATFGLDLVQHLGNWTFSAGPRAHVADSDYMRSYFGVTQRDAAWNPRVAPYRPGGGLRSVGAVAAVGYRLGENWSATVHAGYERLADRPGNSPIVKAFGSRNQVNFGATLSYSFAWKGF